MYKILLVEDKKELCQEIARWLGYEGYEVYTALNAQDGLKLAAEKTPDLIISDIMMPGTSGYELLFELRKREKERLTPFVFLTALADQTNIRKGMGSGADDYLTKPFSRKDLLETIKAQLEKHDLFKQSIESSLKQLRTRIISYLPHELRTPLNGILGFGELLAGYQGDFSDNEIAEMGQCILTSGKRLQRIIENYLVYIQLELSEQYKPGKIPAEILEDIIYSECFTIARNYHRDSLLQTNIQPVDLLITEDYLRKILRELVDNAFRFSSESDYVEVNGKVAGNHYLISVKDNGIGMDQEVIKKIGAFMQFDRKKYEQQGLGLGMAIAKRMTELSGGEMIIESKPGRGTLITCKFPHGSGKE